MMILTEKTQLQRNGTCIPFDYYLKQNKGPAIHLNKQIEVFSVMFFIASTNGEIRPEETSQ